MAVNAKTISNDEFFFGHKACAGCGGSLAVRAALKVLGPHAVCALPAGCMSAVGFNFPQLSFANNAMIAPFAATASVLTGIEAGLRAQGKKPDDCTVVGFAGDGGTADIGIQALSGAIDDLKRKGVQNVLALRGDAAPSCESAGTYRFAKDLVACLAEEGFCVGAAAYPEGHIACSDARANIEHLKQKQDAGAAFFVTQLFFDNAYFYRFWEAALAAGITAPIACGIMPFLGKAQIQRMVFMCGASLPSPIIKLLARYENDPDDLRRAGIEYANEQLVDLAAHGVDGLHVYTMNQPDIARANVAALRAAWQR